MLRMVRHVHQRAADGERLVAAICSELAPFRWTSLTPEMLARWVIGAMDRRCVLDLLAGPAGLGPAGWGDVEPADRHDERVAVLVAFLAEHRWRTWTLSRLVRQLVGTLDTWWASRQCLELELSRLISGG